MTTNLQKYSQEEVAGATPEGLVGMVLAIEEEAEKYSNMAKDLNASAKEIRNTILARLKSANLTSATHESGYRATIRTTPNIAVEDPDVAMKSLKKNNLNIFITPVPKQIIPAHEEINMDQLKSWLKTGTEAQRKLIAGVKVESKEALVIAKK